MSRRPPDLALRRLVAELATAAPSDVAAVIAGLDEAQQERVRALLGDYMGSPLDAPEPVPASSSILSPPERPPGVSSWLEARLDGREGAMTPHALDALRGCAGELTGQPAASLQAEPADARPGWLGAGLGLLGRRRAS